MSQRLYRTFESFSQVLDAISECRRKPKDKILAAASFEKQLKFRAAMKPQLDKLVEFGADKEHVQRLYRNALSIFRIWEERDYLAPDKQAKAELAMVKFMGTFYSQTSQELERVQKGMDAKPVQYLLGIAPLTLLQINGLITLLYLIALTVYLESAIGAHIRKLTEDCNLIAARKPVLSRKLASTEIGALQSSFFLMSQQVLDNELRRKSYLFLLQEIQLRSLEDCRAAVESLSNLAGIAEKVRERASKALQNLTRLKDLLASMTEQLQEQTADDFTPTFQTCNSKELITQVLNSLDAFVQSRGIKLCIEVEEHNFAADPSMIERVLLNLLSNAVKYSPDHAELRIRCFLEKGLLKFEFEDKGPGISEEGQKRLFRRFEQLPSEDGIRRSGSGLGLAICKDFVEAHGGSLSLRSEVGKGSCFYFSLPPERSTAPRPAQIKIQNKAVAAVDDSPNLFQSIQTRFIVVLSLFLTTQILVFSSLHGLLSESAERSEFYAAQKAKLFDNERCFLDFVRFENRLHRTALSRNIAGLKSSLPILKSQMERVGKMRAAEKDPLAVAIYEEIIKEEQQLFELFIEAQDNLEELLADPESIRQRTLETLRPQELSWLKLLDHLNSGMNSSYDFSEKVRKKILYVAFAAAVADILLIAAIVFLSLQLVGRILILRAKTETFAAGNRIRPTLGGNDELTFLDLRLCRVANALQDAESRRQELLASINHDLRTPLSSVFASLENISQGVYGALDETTASLASLSRELTGSLLTQINDLLLLEKLESARYEADFEEFSLFELVSELNQKLSSKLERKNLLLESELSQSFKSGIVSLDRQLTESTVAAVLKNAIEASDEGGKILLSASFDESDCIITISNSGKYFAEELLPQVFERFRFINGEALSGFGLPLAFRACKRQGGSLCVASSSPEGTEMKISLPLKGSDYPDSKAMN